MRKTFVLFFALFCGLGLGTAQDNLLAEAASTKNLFRAKPELVWPVNFCAGSPLPVGRVDLSAVVSGYSHSGFAIASRTGPKHGPLPVQMPAQELRRKVSTKPPTAPKAYKSTQQKTVGSGQLIPHHSFRFLPLKLANCFSTSRPLLWGQRKPLPCKSGATISGARLLWVTSPPIKPPRSLSSFQS